MDRLRHFREVWLVDFEFRQPDGERPEPHCMVAREFRTGRTLRIWGDELAALDGAPFATGSESLSVAYYSSAEWGCFFALGWQPPARILDLFTEFRRLTNGLTVPCGNGLLGALAYFGLPAIDGADKQDMRALAIRGGPFTAEERRALLGYCETDVDALARLLPRMLPSIDLPRALLRGRYMAAAARMERTGIPVDVATLEALRANWGRIKGRLIEEVDAGFGVYVPTGQTLDPDSTFGADVLRTAEDWAVDPYALAEAAREVWKEEREAEAEQREALRAARKRTGATRNRIARLENLGADHSSWPGFDVAARELASEYPALGIGRGFEHGTGFDDTDYSGRLWEMLRQGNQPPKLRYDPKILKRAAELVSQAGPNYRSERSKFSARRFAEWLTQEGIPWPRLPSGQLALDDETFRQMARTHPAVAPLRELRHSLGEMRLFSDLAVGSDGRNRCLLSAFRSLTGRNQPSNARFIFGPSVWLRGLIKPEPGQAVAYADWSQQEFGIAAGVSGDSAMMDAYASGDPYLSFAKQARVVPSNATKRTHPRQRELFKICALAVQYGMGPDSLARSLDQSTAMARELLRLHRETYPVFWQWSEAAVNHAMLRGWLETVFGWRVHVGPRANPRSLANFPMQANGAEMLRLACCLATERGIRVCAPVHDALLIEGPADSIGAVVGETQAAMAEASRAVLGDFELRSDAKVVTWPDRYCDPRGKAMWNTVLGLLNMDGKRPPPLSGDGRKASTYMDGKRPPVQSPYLSSF